MGTSSKAIQMGRKERQVTGRGKEKENETKGSPRFYAAGGFMKSRFLPLLKTEQQQSGGKAEEDFKYSLSLIAAEYGIELLDMSGMTFPYNIVAAHWDTKSKLQRINGDISLRIVKDNESGNVSLATIETVDTRQTLYYIPIVPLYTMLKNKYKKRCATWLLTVCSYMLREAGVPMYNNDCTVKWRYEMIEDYWKSCIDDWEEDGAKIRLNALNEATIIAEIMAVKMANGYHLGSFKERIEQFVPQNRLEQKCHCLAQETYSIWQRYPNHFLFEHIDYTDEYDEDIRADAYISFVARTDGILSDELVNSVNEELNNGGTLQEPTIRRLYNSPSLDTALSLNYERLVFRLIRKLSNLINEVEEWRILPI